MSESEKNIKKIGVMGGTFDPPHIGHLLAAQSVADELLLDEVLFVPTGKKVYKSSDGIAEDNRRLDMVSLAIFDNPIFKMSDIEVKNQDVNYTANTLEKLKNICLNQGINPHFYFIVGGDSLDYMEDWFEPQRIFNQCTVAAVARKGFNMSVLKNKAEELKAKFNADIVFAQMPGVDFSSSMIKKCIKEGKSVRYMLCDKVYDYIIKNNLYN